MIKAPKEKRGSIASDLMPDLTPLLDVMFMLIVFFILTANTVPHTLDLTLPDDTDQIARPINDPNTLNVGLLPQAWHLEGQSYTTEIAFKDALKQAAQSGKRVVITSDKDLPINRLLSLLTFLRKHKIEAADIMMQPSPQ